jgi:hypothetical protein
MLDHDIESRIYGRDPQRVPADDHEDDDTDRQGAATTGETK